MKKKQKPIFLKIFIEKNGFLLRSKIKIENVGNPEIMNRQFIFSFANILTLVSDTKKMCLVITS